MFRAASRSASRPRTSCPARAAPTAPVVIVGEAPGANEDAQGRPFVGRAGAILDDLLQAAGLAREDVFITNVVKARPPGNRDPRADEVAHHLPFLDAQLEVIRPRLLVPLGRHALKRFAPGLAIGEVHGHVVQRDGRTPVPDVPPRRGAAQPAPADDAGRRRPRAEAGAVNPIRVGCSGWNYADWRGVLYPPGCPQRNWLQRYAEVFDTVEVNNTFYRLPTLEAVRGWVAQTPPDFVFAREVQPLPDPRQAPDRHGPRRRAACSSASSRSPPRPRWARCSGSCRATSAATTSAWPSRWSTCRRAATPSSSATRAGSPTTSWQRCAPTASRSSSATTPSARGSATS